MKKGKGITYGVIFILALVAGILIWNNYRVEVTKRPTQPIKPPAVISGECGIENCHGLEIVCGSNVPEMCTMEYQTGDICRQFARCEKVNGKCQQVKDPKFENCKSCVEACQDKYPSPADEIKFSQCETECAGKAD